MKMQYFLIKIKKRMRKRDIEKKWREKNPEKQSEKKDGTKNEVMRKHKKNQSMGVMHKVSENAKLKKQFQ